ncbi:MAG: ethylbenzene dehydrogenase-related protein [Rhodospirillaceae bacterium]
MSLGIMRALGISMVAGAAMLAPESAGAVDWAKVPEKNITLFYPAQISWDRLFTPGRHSGQRRWPEKTCVGCHGDIDEGPLGDSLVDGEKDKEPAPIAGKPPFVKAKVKTAHENDTLFVRIEFDPGKQPNVNMDKDFETKVTMILDDGGVKDSKNAGCWITCHSDVESMRWSVTGTTKYLTDTRIPKSGGDIIKPEEELAKMRAAGYFLEYWQARINPGKPAVAVDGTILEKRSTHETPAVKVSATVTKGVYTVIMSRKLDAGPGYKKIVPDKKYTVGFAIHAGRASQRFHYVSFERSLMLDGIEGVADLLAPGSGGGAAR